MVKQVSELKDINTSSKLSKDFLNAIGKILFDTKTQNKEGTKSIVDKIAEQIMNLGGVKTAIQGLRIGGPAPAGGGEQQPGGLGGLWNPSGSTSRTFYDSLPTSAIGKWMKKTIEYFGRVVDFSGIDMTGTVEEIKKLAHTLIGQKDKQLKASHGFRVKLGKQSDDCFWKIEKLLWLMPVNPFPSEMGALLADSGSSALAF